MDKRVLLLAALAGCVIVEDGKEPTGDTGLTTEDTDDTTPPPTGDTGIEDPDADADGFPASVDCDDNDASIHPDAEELCDGIDNNCDAGIDDAAAATLDGANHATLDDAVAAAAAGSVIDICPGDWTVTGIALGKGADLTLVGVAGRDATSISEASGLTVASLSDTAMLTIEGLTITGAVGVPAIVAQDVSTLTVLSSAISGNMGSGIDLSGEQTPLGLVVHIEDTLIENNDAASGKTPTSGGGINAFNGFDLTIVDSTISGNSALEGGGLYVGGIFFEAALTLQGTTIDSNTADIGGGVAAVNIAITGDGASFVTNNVANNDGGGMALYRSPVSDLLVSTNSALQGGGVAALYDPFVAGSPKQNDLTGVIIDDNDADAGGGIYVAAVEAAYVDGYSAVTLNEATTQGGGAHVAAQGYLESTGADWGDAYGGENIPDDVSAGGQSYVDYGPGATFACNGSTGCQ